MNAGQISLVFHPETDQKTPKYLQIVNAIKEAIRRGDLKKGDPLLSINEFSDEYLLSRDTVQKAYLVLRQEGIIVSVRGKGFYTNRTDIAAPYRILLLFNKISNYKKQVYNAFVQTMGENAVVDLKIHHYNARIFETLVLNSLYDYDYYLIMPHFYEQQELAMETIRKIAPEKVIMLDKDLDTASLKYAAVYQDFTHDIYEALESGIDLLKKYTKLVLVHPRIIPYPAEIKNGFRFFCSNNNFNYETIHEIDLDRNIEKGEVYIVIEETDLVNLIKICRQKKYSIGKDLGIISYNETPLKEILLDGITVISTDHVKMGEIAAKLILENRKEKVKNPFMMIRRKSL